MQSKTIKFSATVKLEQATAEKMPKVTLFAFDSKGRLLASAPVDKEAAALTLPASVSGQTIRLLLSPTEKIEPKTARLADLSRSGAYEKRLRVDPRNPKITMKILESIWKPWILCRCTVRGRVVRKIGFPDGTVKDLPLCNARVVIAEVDRLPKIILRLPDHLILKLRDDLVAVMQRPPFPPEPPETPGPRVTLPPQIFAAPNNVEFQSSTSAMNVMSAASELSMQTVNVNLQQLSIQMTDLEVQSRLKAIAGSSSPADIRNQLVNLTDVVLLFICNWPWFDWFFWYRAFYYPRVETNENGEFETTIWYPCFGDKPDLYFAVQQLQSGVWKYVYKPPIRCNTYWNYACGTEVTIVVADPSAVACVPDDPVNPPAGVGTWVMPFAVGGTTIWGSPPPILRPFPLPPLIPEAPLGWVKQSGKTDYAGYTDAPFGGYLGLRHGYSNDIPNSKIMYYRWSIQKVGDPDGTWTQLNTPVYRTYVKQKPGQLPTFPAKQLGPKTVGDNANLFEFKSAIPPEPDEGDPAATTTSWPLDDFVGDIYSGFWNTNALSPDVAGAAGQYRVKLEVFDSAGNPTTPGAGTFNFIAPTGKEADGVTFNARNITLVELDGSGFIFNLWIDNNPTNAIIDAPKIGATSVADKCGFLRYNPADPTPVSIAFHALHPNNFAVFSFTIIRGAINLTNANTGTERVDASPAGPYSGDGAGNFSHDFIRSQLMCGPAEPGDCCVNAAFAESLHVYGTATTGWGSKIGYDAFASRGFALAPQPP